MFHHLFKPAQCCAVAATLTTANATFAQHSDVEFEYADSKIAIEFGSEGRVFEADLPTSGLFAQSTDDPGFDSEDLLLNGLLPGDLIGFNILGPLLYHDGNAFASIPTGVAIVIEDNASGVLTIDGATTSASGIIAEAEAAGGARGDIHAHIDFSLTPAGLGAPEFGAYGVLMQITTDRAGIANSDSFYAIFNFGLEENELLPGPHLHDAVEDFAALVPEPGSAIALAAGIGLLATRRRKG